ncbi:MAG: hypothetical protein ACKOQY_04430 [Bacteroidota bacterium]
MKQLKRFQLLLVLLLSAGLNSMSQSVTDRGLNYQAVVRDNEGNMMPNAGVNFRFTFRTITYFGFTYDRYKETHVATTNSLGIVNLVMGTGTPVSPFSPWDFENSIPWHDPLLNLVVEVDPTGSGTAYSLISTSPFRGVPYSYFAKKSDEATTAQYAVQAQNAFESYYAYWLNSPYTEAISLTNPSNTVSGSFTGNGSGLTNLSASQVSSGILNASFGGTGLNATSVAAGTMLVASPSGTWNILPPGNQGQVLKMNGGVPTWSNESTSGKLVNKYFTQGTPSSPTSTPGFISPVCTLTVTSSQQTLFIISTLTLYGYSATSPYVDSPTLSLIIKSASTGFEQTLSSGGVTLSNDLSRRQSNFHGYPCCLSPGVYYIGIRGYRAAGAVGTIYGEWYKQDILVFD